MEFVTLKGKAKKKHWKEIIKFWELVDTEFIPALSTRSDWPKLHVRDADNSEIITAIKGKSVVGIAVYWKYYAPLKSAYLQWLIVKPAHRRKGLGRKLLKKTIATLRRNKAGKIKLSTYSTNTKAQALYHSTGFRTYLTRRNAKKKGVHKLYLILQIKKRKKN